MAEEKQEQRQTVTREPGPYPFAGEEIWQKYLQQYFGDEEAGTPGYLGLLRGSKQYERDLWDDYYQGTLDPAYNKYEKQIERAMRSGQRYQDRLEPIQKDVLNVMKGAKQNPIGLSIGGGNFNLIPQGSINMAKDWYDMKRDYADRLLGFESQTRPTLAKKHLLSGIMPERMNMQKKVATNPDAITAKYIQNSLWPMAKQIQQWRYGIPSQTQTGETSGSVDPGTMGEVGGWLGLIGEGANIIDDLGGFGEGGWLSDIIGSTKDVLGGLF